MHVARRTLFRALCVCLSESGPTAFHQQCLTSPPSEIAVSATRRCSPATKTNSTEGGATKTNKASTETAPLFSRLVLNNAPPAGRKYLLWPFEVCVCFLEFFIIDFSLPDGHACLPSHPPTPTPTISCPLTKLQRWCCPRPSSSSAAACSPTSAPSWRP